MRTGEDTEEAGTSVPMAWFRLGVGWDVKAEEAVSFCPESVNINGGTLEQGGPEASSQSIPPLGPFPCSSV